MQANVRRVVIAIFAVASLTGSALGQPARGAPRPEVRGMLKFVDAKAATITIATFDARRDSREPIEKTFALAKEVEIALSMGVDRRGHFKEGKLADLAAGAPIGLTLSADEKFVEAIVAESPVVRGVIKFVDADKRSITIMTRPGRGGEGDEERSYTVAPDAEVAVDDGLGRRFSVKEAKLAELATGALATLRLATDQKSVESILTEGPTLYGQFKEMHAAGAITVVIGAGRGEAEEKTLEIVKGALVLIDDGRGRRLSVKEAKLSDVPAGAAVSLRLSADQKSIVQLRAEGPNMPCMVKSVDVTKNTITVLTRVARGDNPEEKTLPVAKDARILVEGAASKLADIKAGDEAFAMLRLSLDSKTVQGITVGRGR